MKKILAVALAVMLLLILSAAATLAAKDDTPANAKGGTGIPSDLKIRNWIVCHASVEGNTHLFLIRPDGSDLTQITTGDSQNLYPTWSHNKSRIAFMRQTSEEEDRNGDIYVINFNGTGLRRLTIGGDYHCPDWSPSGNTIIFDGYGSGIQTVKIGGNLLKVVLDDEYADRPDWSPDGSQVAFHRPDLDPFPGLGELFIMNADGSDIRSLGIGFNPDWSPDGTQIAFCRRTTVTDPMDVYVINVDGTGLINLTDGHGGFWPDWSPDGEKIVFNFYDYENENYEIGIVDAGGGTVTNITNSPEVNEIAPQW
jgi:TolB protein